MSVRNFEKLRTCLQADLAADTSPWADPLWTRLSPESGRELHGFLRWLAQQRGATYSRFGNEDELLVALATAAERLGTTSWNLDAFLAEAEKDADARWLIGTPLVNLMPLAGVERLSEEQVLVPVPDEKNSAVPDWFTVETEVARILGADLRVGWRWTHGGTDDLLDTRHTASIVSVEVAPRDLARQRAMEKARHLLAGWTLLHPPEADAHMPLWPAATEWLPQPSLHVEQPARRLADRPDEDAGRRLARELVHAPDDAALYRLPDDWRLLAPVRALAAVEGSRAAAALLSCAWNLYLAARLPTDLPWIDRLVLIMHAREALCEPPNREIERVDDRWHAAATRLELARRLRRQGWAVDDLTAVTGRMKELRNLGVHGADAVLLRLGWPTVRNRTMAKGRVLPGERLASVYLREGTSPTFHAVRELAVALSERLDAADYEDQIFERLLGTAAET